MGPLGTFSRSKGAFNINRLKRLDLLDKDTLNQIVQLRKLRNMLIHDIEIPDKDFLFQEGEKARKLLEHLNSNIR